MNATRRFGLEELNNGIETPEFNAKLEELKNCIRARDPRQRALLSVEDCQKILLLQNMMPELTEIWQLPGMAVPIQPPTVALQKVSIQEKDILQMLTFAPEVEGLVFSGGGAKGSVYPGVLRALERRKMMSKIERVAGSSAGAMTALLISIGYTANELEETVLFKMNLRTLVHIDPINGRDDGALVRNFIANLERKKVREYLGIRVQKSYLLTPEGYAAENGDYMSDKSCAKHAALIQMGLKMLYDPNYMFVDADIDNLCTVLEPKYREKIEILKKKRNNQHIKQKMRKYFSIDKPAGRQILTRAEYLSENPGAGKQYDAILFLLQNFVNQVPGAEFTFEDAANLRAILRPEHRHKIKSLYMTGTNEDTRKMVEFCVETTPNVSRAKAAQASGAHPVVFKPVYIEGIGHVSDGGTSDNAPVRLLEKYEPQSDRLSSEAGFSTKNLIFVLRENPGPQNDEVASYHNKVLGSAIPVSSSFSKVVKGKTSELMTGVNSVAMGYDSQDAIKDRSHQAIVLDVGNIETLTGMTDKGENLQEDTQIGIKKAERTLEEYLDLRQFQFAPTNYESLKELLSKCATSELCAVYHSEAISFEESESVLALLTIRNEIILELEAININKLELERKVKVMNAYFDMDKESSIRAYQVLNRETKGRLFEALEFDHPIVSSLKWFDEANKKANKIAKKLKSARNTLRANSSSGVSRQTDLDAVIKYFEDTLSRFTEGDFTRLKSDYFEKALKNLDEAQLDKEAVCDIYDFMSKVPVIPDSVTIQRRGGRGAQRDLGSSALSSRLYGSKEEEKEKDESSTEEWLNKIGGLIDAGEFSLAKFWLKRAVSSLPDITDKDQRDAYDKALALLFERFSTEKNDALISRSIISAKQAIKDKKFDGARNYIEEAFKVLLCISDETKIAYYRKELQDLFVQLGIPSKCSAVDQLVIDTKKAIVDKNFEEAKRKLEAANSVLSSIGDEEQKNIYILILQNTFQLLSDEMKYASTHELITMAKEAIGDGYFTSAAAAINLANMELDSIKREDAEGYRGELSALKQQVIPAQIKSLMEKINARLAELEGKATIDEYAGLLLFLNEAKELCSGMKDSGQKDIERKKAYEEVLQQVESRLEKKKPCVEPENENSAPQQRSSLISSFSLFGGGSSSSSFLPVGGLRSLSSGLFGSRNGKSG